MKVVFFLRFILELFPEVIWDLIKIFTFRAGPRPPSLPIILDPIFSANVAGGGSGGRGGGGEGEREGRGGGGGGGLVVRADQPPIS